MAERASGHLGARTLRQAGVSHLFTLCGGHLLPIYDGCLTEGVGVLDVRHEQAAAHAGDAFARLTRGIGAAVVVPGRGVTDAVTGVANTYAARSPLLLIGGAAPARLRGLGALQETVHLHHRQRRRLGPDPESSGVVLRRSSGRRHVAADDPLRPHGRGARRPGGVHHRSARDRPGAAAGAGLGRGLVPQCRARPRGVPEEWPGLDGHQIAA